MLSVPANGKTFDVSVAVKSDGLGEIAAYGSAGVCGVGALVGQKLNAPIVGNIHSSHQALVIADIGGAGCRGALSESVRHKHTAVLVGDKFPIFVKTYSRFHALFSRGRIFSFKYTIKI
jgi:hypothetical protein